MWGQGWWGWWRATCAETLGTGARAWPRAAAAAAADADDDAVVAAAPPPSPASEGRRRRRGAEAPRREVKADQPPPCSWTASFQTSSQA